MKVIYKGKSRVLMNYSPLGQKRFLATETRIRRKAKRLGLYAKYFKDGWSLLSEKHGESLTARLFDWQIEDKLNALLREPLPVKTKAVSPRLTFREQMAQTARRMQSRQQLIQQYATQPSLSARLRQLVGDRPPAVKVLLGVGGPTAGHGQRGI